MGFHGVDLLRLFVKLDGLTTLGFSTGVGFLVFMWPMHGLFFRVNLLSSVRGNITSIYFLNR